MFVCLMALASAPRASFAQSAEDKSQARDLGARAFEALDHKEWSVAEDLFRRADSLFHAPTLTLGLARAQAQQSKFVEAWESYHRIILEGAPPGSSPAFVKAVEDAGREIASVEPRRGRLTIVVSGPDKPAVTLDDVPLSVAALGAPRFVNPGSHRIQATAAGYAPLSTTANVAEGQTATVPLTMTVGTTAGPDVAPAAPAAPTAGATIDTPPPGLGKPNRTPAFVAFGVGAAGLVAGGLTGFLALRKHSTLHDSPCSAGPCSSDDASTFNSDLSSYHAMSTISTVGFLVAGVGAAAGVVLWVTAPRKQETAVTVAPYVGLGSLGAAGSF
jgi:hypothetical protein